MIKYREITCERCMDPGARKYQAENSPLMIWQCSKCGFHRHWDIIERKPETKPIATDDGPEFTLSHEVVFEISEPYGYFLKKDATGGIRTGVVCTREEYLKLLNWFKTKKDGFYIQLTINSLEDGFYKQEVYKYSPLNLLEFNVEDRIEDAFGG